ncbi:MAG: hypothetical protein NW205_00095 [Hyphomicrobiaceae bacterium]|nr:hypothetical protein [Hyphomicrobiaceae bacterium]
MMFWFRVGVIVAVLLALAPLICVVIAGTIADAHGCRLHEGFVNPCMISGEDWGKALYTMAVMGWFAIATLPLGAMAIVVWLVVEIVVAVRRRGRPKPT